MRTPFAILTVVFLLGCQRQPDGWRPMPPVTTTQPRQEDIVGSYLLTQQTITSNGLAVLQGRQCQLDLGPDGSFSITNYPIWIETSSEDIHITNFVFTTGHWAGDKIGSTHGQPLWGVRFDANTHILATALTGKQAPYGLFMIYGDGDEGREMVFEKRK